MRNLSNTNRSLSSSKTSGKDGDITNSFTGENSKILIKQANSVLITRIFNHYGLRLDPRNKKAICPFPTHKGGRESTGSFMYYPHSNTFYCFGCYTGTTCCDFVANMEHITRDEAAAKILTLFKGNIAEDIEFEPMDFSERLEIMLDFSNAVREFRQANYDEKSASFIEQVCWVYDAINARHKLDNEALRSIVQELKEKINSYIPCLTL